MIYRIYKWFSTIPQRCGYDSAHAKKYGIKSKHFWYRQIFHFVPAVTYGFLMSIGPPMLQLGGLLSITAFVGIMEYYQIEKGGQGPVKSLVDPMVWLSGFIFGTWIWGRI